MTLSYRCGTNTDLLRVSLYFVISFKRFGKYRLLGKSMSATYKNNLFIFEPLIRVLIIFAAILTFVKTREIKCFVFVLIVNSKDNYYILISSSLTEVAGGKFAKGEENHFL